MMGKSYTASEKDTILREAFRKLADRGITSKWSTASYPFTELRNECRSLIADPAFAIDLQKYLKSHTIIRRAVEMFFTQISMSARAQWDNVPDEIRPITARGWFLGRWIPTFLIIDGPIGRFICKGESPLCSRLKSQHRQYPLLSAARDFLNNDLFRRLRNGFGHWAFDWEVMGTESYVVAYDWESGLPTDKLHQEEADAFHIVTFALIELLDDVVISQRNKV